MELGYALLLRCDERPWLRSLHQLCQLLSEGLLSAFQMELLEGLCRALYRGFAERDFRRNGITFLQVLPNSKGKVIFFIAVEQIHQGARHRSERFRVGRDEPIEPAALLRKQVIL